MHLFFLYFCIMYKRGIAYTFLLLANLILLAHTAIPHHHHQNLLCFEREHCSDEGIQHEHSKQEQNHQHDSDPFSNLCLLADDFVSASSNGASRTVICQHSITHQEFNQYFYNSSVDKAISSPLINGISFAPRLIPYYYSFCHPPFSSRPPPRLSCSMLFS